MQDIQCSEAKTLVEIPRGTPACVNRDTAEKLKDRGWQVIGQVAYEQLRDMPNTESGEPPAAGAGMTTDSLHAVPNPESDERVTGAMAKIHSESDHGAPLPPNQYMPTANFTYPLHVSLGQEFDIEFSYAYDHAPDNVDSDDGEIQPTKIYVGYRPEVDLLNTEYGERIKHRYGGSGAIKYVPFEGKTHDYDIISEAMVGYINRSAYELLPRGSDGLITTSSDMYNQDYENAPPTHDRITMRINEMLVPSEIRPTIDLRLDNWRSLKLYFYPTENGGYLSTDSHAVFLTDHQSHLTGRGVDSEMAASVAPLLHAGRMQHDPTGNSTTQGKSLPDLISPPHQPRLHAASPDVSLEILEHYANPFPEGCITSQHWNMLDFNEKLWMIMYFECPPPLEPEIPGIPYTDEERAFGTSLPLDFLNVTSDFEGYLGCALNITDACYDEFGMTDMHRSTWQDWNLTQDEIDNFFKFYPELRTQSADDIQPSTLFSSEPQAQTSRVVRSMYLYGSVELQTPSGGTIRPSEYTACLFDQRNNGTFTMLKYQNDDACKKLDSYVFTSCLESAAVG